MILLQDPQKLYHTGFIDAPPVFFVHLNKPGRID